MLYLLSTPYTGAITYMHAHGMIIIIPMHAGIQVGFGELDYSEVEGSGGVNVVIQKQNENFGNLVFTLKTLPFSEVTERPGDIVLPDAAERKSEHNCPI